MTEEELEKKVKKRKSYLKLNILSLFFTAVSFISVTLAWFAYSGLVTTKTEVNVKAWYIEFNNKGNAVSNNIVISLNDVYPGMDVISETIDIKNSGDSPASIEYKIKSVRILDKELDVTNQTKLVDELSHSYPFHINTGLSTKYANAKDGTGNFVVSASWPLVSTEENHETEWGNDSFDTEWGMKAHEFQKNEALKHEQDPNYQIKPAIEIVISLEATQYLDQGDAIDPDFVLGKSEMYDVVKNEKCSRKSTTCLKTYIISKDSKITDDSVLLVPDIYTTLPSGIYSDFNTLYGQATTGWTVTHRNLSVEDMLNVVSNDISETIVINNTISNQMVGVLNYSNRVQEVIDRTIDYNGYIRYSNTNFPYFTSSSCYWLSNEYDANNQFAFVKINTKYSKIYAQTKTKNCKVLPVIEVSKAKLRTESSS